MVEYRPMEQILIQPLPLNFNPWRSEHTGVIGWAIILGFAAVFDCYIISQGKQSLSQAIWDNSKQPIVGPLAFGFWSSLTYHFFIETKFKEIKRWLLASM